MKKAVILFLFVLSFARLVSAKPVDVLTAKTVGRNFLASRVISVAFGAGLNLELVYTSGSAAYNPAVPGPGTSYFYVFNINQNKGFVIVTADDRVQPVLAYSDKAGFVSAGMPAHVAKWLEGYKAGIRYVITNNIPATAKTSSEWATLLHNKALPQMQPAAAVSPLLQTAWDQAPYYNALCPYNSASAQLTVTGCVATAMAQVMKFWNYPATGTGFHTYTHPQYGTLSMNFASASYQWGAMPSHVTSPNSHVATLMYHCGISVDMNYGIAANGGSTAAVHTWGNPVARCTENALKINFGYKSTVTSATRSNYSQPAWMTLIKGELDAGRPVIYTGFINTTTGHAFVCDGYDNNDLLHFNWGWGGLDDGYYEVNGIIYDLYQAVLVGIEPPAPDNSTPAYDMRLHSAIAVNPDPIPYNNGIGFDVSANVSNQGTTAFSGAYAAAIFNAHNEFIGFVQTKTGYTLNANSNYPGPLVFSSAGMPVLTPGSYTIGIYYKPNGTQEWVALANGNYQNFISVQVGGNNSNPLKLYAAISTSPATIVRNKPFTVSFDLVNSGPNTFSGDVSVDICKSDGTWLRSLAVKNGLSLPANAHFTNGLTYTISDGMNDTSGTYKLYVWNKSAGGNWMLAGSSTFANPISVQVVEPGMPPDAYEANDTITQPYSLPVTFTGNYANPVTSGSTCHHGNDTDYYKINLPAGYNYAIDARLHDRNIATNGKTYSGDALFSYSANGTAWSDTYDDVIPAVIQLKGAGTVYFMVAPFFSGETGSYLLDILVTRSIPVPLSNAKEITGFTVPGMVGSASINSGNATVSATVTAATDITTLVPVISVSNFASINPPSGSSLDFSNPLSFAVTAQDSSNKMWTVTVTRQDNTGIAAAVSGAQISIYPNPAGNRVNIDFTAFDGHVFHIELTDLHGHVLESLNVETGKGLDIPVAKYQNGMYLLQLNTDQGAIIRKLFIAR